VEHLTDLEIRCLRMYANGKADQDISAAIGHTSTTTRFVFARLLEKLKAKSRVHAVVVAIKSGAINIDDLDRPNEIGSGTPE